MKVSGNKLSIVFFGSGPVAAKSLALLAEEFTVEAVITKPTTKHEMAASAPDATLYTVSNRHELDDLIATHTFESKVGVLIDFGIIVSRTVIDAFPLGIVNSHFSLLPEWRGADPISFAILSGQRTTGVSLMLINEKMDEGLILAQSPYAIPEDATTPELTDALIEVSHNILVAILPRYASGDIIPVPQDSEVEPTYSRKLTKEDGLIDWSKPAEHIEREIRAFAEWPKSRATIAGKDVIITKAHVAAPEVHDSGTKEGHAYPAPGGFIGVATANGDLIIEKLKPAGKKEMTAAEFLRGYGQKLGTNR